VLPPICLVRLADVCKVAGNLDMLRKLTLLVRRQWWGTEKPSIKAFRKAPALVDVSLFGIPLDSVDLPLIQLTRFRGHPLNTDEAMETLRLAPHLESYTVACTPTDSPALPSSPVNHTSLHDLKLTGKITPLKHLTLPALKTLTIECPEGGFNAYHFVLLMQRSGAMLRCLHLTVDFIPSVSLLECLQATPVLEELTLCNLKDRVHSVFVDSVLKKLTFKPGSAGTVLVPQLRRLEVLNCSCHFDGCTLEEMLWSRWHAEDGGRRHLEYFGLEAGCTVRQPTICEDILRLPRARKMREGGMVLHIRNVEKARLSSWSGTDFRFGMSRTWLGSSR